MGEIEEGDHGGTTRLLQAEEGGGNSKREDSDRPKEPWKGEYVKCIVYAGVDAIVTSFSLISSISASRRSSDVLVLGFANVVAYAISMGLGDHVATRTEKDVAAKKKSVTDWDVHHRCAGEQNMELIQQYQAHGMKMEDATRVVEIFAKYKDILIDEKMAAEKGTLPPDEEEKPWKSAVITFMAFLVFGSAPLLSFIVLIPITESETVMFLGACFLAALSLALLGLAKAKIAGDQNYLFSVCLTLFNGALAAAAAYSLGWTLKHVTRIEE